MTAGYLGDRLIVGARWDKTRTRKLFTAAGNLGGILGLVIICFAGCDRAQAVSGFCIALALSGINNAGYLVSYDIYFD